jgi:hypothetical protein
MWFLGYGFMGITYGLGMTKSSLTLQCGAQHPVAYLTPTIGKVLLERKEHLDTV